MRHAVPPARTNEIRDQLCNLPRKMLTLQSNKNMTEFVLHDLCGESCFNLDKAAYFVDNPDFNCFKGVAGFSRDEAYRGSDIWQDSQAFSEHMKNSSFNQKVRAISRESLWKNSQDQLPIEELAALLALGQDYAYCAWPIKHENHGLLLYQTSCPVNQDIPLLDGFTFLSFCPIF